MSTLTPAVPDTRRRWAGLVVLCLGFLMVQLDQTIVNVALPTIAQSLQVSESRLSWVINAYLVGFGGVLLFVGRLGDLVGRRRVFLLGVLVFAAASLACGLAATAPILIVARFVQGVGAAMGSAVILAMIVTMFPDPRERARALGVYSFVAAGGASLGLLLGGVLTDAIGWHWIFFVNLPISVVALVAARRLLPRDSGLGLAVGADGWGALLLVASIMLTVYGIVGAADNGWVTIRTIGTLLAAVVLAAGFVVRQRNARTPLVPLSIFASRTVAGANMVSMLLLGGLFGMFFIGSLYLQLVLHYSPLAVGVALLPFAAAIGVVSLAITERLIARLGARLTMTAGLVLATAGMVLLRLAGEDTRYAPHLLGAFLLLGVGAGLAFPSVFSTAISTATADNSGLISGLVNTTQQVGGALGLSVLAVVAANHTTTSLASGTTRAVATLDGYHVAFVLAAALLAAGAVLALVLLPTERRTRATTQPETRTQPEAER